MGYYSKRVPWPYHIVIDGTGLLLGAMAPTTGDTSKAGATRRGSSQLVSTKIQDISAVAPPDYSYGGTSPVSDRQEPYESLALGMGLRLQEKWQDFRYAHAMAVDLSVWPWCKGPEINTLTPASVDGGAVGRTFFELGGALFTTQGRYVLRRNNDTTWAMTKDFGAGVTVLNTTVFTSNFDGVQRVWAALSTGVAQYSTDGAAWTPMATFGALAFATIGREWWWADDVNRLRKCDTNADPRAEANYTSLIFRAGDKSSAITALMVSAAGTLVISKGDGLYTLDQAGDDHVLFPFLKFAPDVQNGRAWGQFENSLYTSYGRSLLKVGPDLSGQDVAPEKMINSDSPVRGRVTAFAAVGGMFAYVGLFNPDTLDSYLMKFGGYATQNGETKLLDVWHGSISPVFTARSIQAVHVSTVGADSAHTRAYLGFSDGSIGYLVNPCTPNPAACAAYRFHVGDGYVDLPYWHGGYHASRKSLRHIAVTGPRLDANNYVLFDYKLAVTDTLFTALGNVFDSTVYEEATFPTTAVTTLASFRVHLQNTAATSCPLVSSVAVGHALRPRRYMSFEADILCADGLVRRDGVPLRIGREEIQHVVELAVDNPGAVTVTLPNESTQQLSFTDYSVAQAFDEIGRTWRGSLHIKAVQWSPQAA